LRLRRRLLAWYRQNARDLPWRRTRDPYRIWISEVLLQQTRIETALPYYERFVRALPDARALADAREERVLKLWEGLGYYRRVANLQRAARFIVRESGGRYPASAEEWRALPGVGPYTAGAIASIVLGEQTPAVDGNVRRVLTRLFMVDGSAGDAAERREITAHAASLVPPRAPGDFNQALMELGARVCRPRRPRCADCPIQADCRAFLHGRTGGVPAPRRAPPRPERVVAAALLERDGRCLLVKRPASGLLAGMWEFPGTPVGPRVNAARALEREIAERWGIPVRAGEEIARVRHDYSHFALTLRVYRCREGDRGVRAARRPQAGDAAAASSGETVRWVKRNSLRRLALHGAMRKVLEAIG
jgi:A/G-specific adenine glycosylase